MATLVTQPDYAVSSTDAIESRVEVRHATAAEIENWDDVIASFDNHRLIHRRAWLESLQASGQGRPAYLVCTRDNEIVGCWTGMLMKRGPLRMFGSPPPGSQTLSMGPTFDPECVSEEALIAAGIEYLEREQGIHLIELIGTLDVSAMRRLGFEGNTVTTHRAVMTPQDPDATFKNLKTNARRNVKRAIKLGLEIREVEDEAFVDEAYEQIQEVCQRRGEAVSFTKQRAIEFFRHMKASGNLLALSVHLPDNGPSIATGMFTIDGRELLLWQWAHRTEHRWYRPTEFMTWTAMQRGMEAGCRTFDLMGGGDFKQKFGAEKITNQHRWIRGRYRWILRARELAYKGHLLKKKWTASRGKKANEEASE